MDAYIFNVLTIGVGIISVLINIWIAQYNTGKNRNIYGIEIETITNHEGINGLNKKLSSGNYTILLTEQNVNMHGWQKYVLGKIKP